jgi:hypothetical protein
VSAGCGPGCGWCGRCTEAWEYDPQEDDRELDDNGQPVVVPVYAAPAAVLDDEDEGELEPPF